MTRATAKINEKLKVKADSYSQGRRTPATKTSQRSNKHTPKPPREHPLRPPRFYRMSVSNTRSKTYLLRIKWRHKYNAAVASSSSLTAPAIYPSCLHSWPKITTHRTWPHAPGHPKPGIASWKKMPAGSVVSRVVAGRVSRCRGRVLSLKLPPPESEAFLFFCSVPTQKNGHGPCPAWPLFKEACIHTSITFQTHRLLVCVAV